MVCIQVAEKDTKNMIIIFKGRISTVTTSGKKKQLGDFSKNGGSQPEEVTDLHIGK